MKKIITIGASSSKLSINKMLVEYAASHLNDVEIVKVDISEFNIIPIFSVEHNSEIGTPKEIIELNNILLEADGYMVSFAEHNGSFAAGYKNVIDWISVQEGKTFNGKPVMLMSAAPGPRGGASVLASAEAYYPHMGAELTGSFSFPSFHKNFQDNKIIDDALQTSLLEKLEMFKAKL
jgi:NAD(P)H-dependent FMN reductase